MTATATQLAPEKTTAQTQNAQRDELIVEHYSLVKALAIHVQRSLPVHVELDDLVNAGLMGLVDAASKFEAGKDVSFRNYSKHRIKGAMIDSLRQQDWASRDLRKRQKQVEALKKSLAEQLDREPTEQEIAAGMGMNLKRYQSLLVDFRTAGIAASQAKVRDEDGKAPEAEIPAAADRNPDSVFARAQMKQRIEHLVRSLPKRHQEVVTLYYTKDMTMREIGNSLGVNESRVSQIHHNALSRMQALLVNQGVQSAAAF